MSQEANMAMKQNGTKPKPHLSEAKRAALKRLNYMGGALGRCAEDGG